MSVFTKNQREEIHSFKRQIKRCFFLRTFNVFTYFVQLFCFNQLFLLLLPLLVFLLLFVCCFWFVYLFISFYLFIIVILFLFCSRVSPLNNYFRTQHFYGGQNVTRQRDSVTYLKKNSNLKCSHQGVKLLDGKGTLRCNIWAKFRFGAIPLGLEYTFLVMENIKTVQAATIDLMHLRHSTAILEVKR